MGEEDVMSNAAKKRLKQILDCYDSSSRGYITAHEFASYARVSAPTARKWLNRFVVAGVLVARTSRYRNGYDTVKYTVVV